ncbi:MAG: LamG domain-containing protein [Planctomycetota bacterium]
MYNRIGQDARCSRRNSRFGKNIARAGIYSDLSVVLLIVVIGICLVGDSLAVVPEARRAEPARRDPNLVAWWTFDEDRGGKGVDASGNGHDGKVFGDTSWVAGAAGPNALSLEDGGVEIADDKLLTPSVYTLCVWLYVPGTDIKAPIIEKGAGRDRCYSLVAINKKVVFSIRGSNKKTYKVGMGKTTVPDHKWTHIAAVYNGDQMLLYVDAKRLGKKRIGKIQACSTVGKPVMFGNRWPQMDRPLSARIDDARLYDKALSAEEITELYAWKGQSKDLAALPEPANRSDNIAPRTQLKWLSGKNAASHNVYFGTDFKAVKSATTSAKQYKGNQKDNTFDPGVMKYGQTYYWRIDEMNKAAPAAVVKGNVWFFTVLDGKARSPNPGTDLKTVATSAKLSWTPGIGAESHNVYFGTDAEQVKNAATSSKVYKKNLTLGDESFDPGPMEKGIYYYWRIDEMGQAGISRGDVWKFQTQGDNLIFQIDLAVPTCDRKDVWEGTAKPGWITWAAKRWSDMYMHDGVWLPTLDGGKTGDPAGINGSGVQFYLTTGSEGQLGIGAKGICRANLGGGGCPKGKAKGDPIANTWAYAVDWAGPYAGDIILLIKGLPAGVYELYSYHNHWEPCKQSTRNCLDCVCGMPPMPSITANALPAKPQESTQDKSENILSRHRLNLPPGTGKGITAVENAYNVAPQHVLSDEELEPSRIKFSTDGSEVLVIYEADKSRPLYPDCARKGREGARGILNAFELINVGLNK